MTGQHNAGRLASLPLAKNTCSGAEFRSFGDSAVMGKRIVSRRKRVLGDLSERQHPGARLVRPVESDDGTPVEFTLAVLQGPEKR